METSESGLGGERQDCRQGGVDVRSGHGFLANEVAQSMRVPFFLAALLLVTHASFGANVASKGKSPPAPIEAAVRLADWQLARMHDGASVSRKTHETSNPRAWEQAVFWVGMTALADAGGPPRIREAILAMGRANQWLPGAKPYFADDHAITQSYLWAATHGAGAEAREPARKSFDRVIDEPAITTLAFFVPPEGYGAAECLKRWCWCDALFMAPPAFVEMSRQT